MLPRRRILALLVSLVFNGILVGAVLQVRFQGKPVTEQAVEVMLELPLPPVLPPPPPPPPEVKQLPTRHPSVKTLHPVREKLAKPAQKTEAPVEPGPPVHFLDPSGEVSAGSGQIGGGQLGRGKRRGAERLSMHAPSDYADRVKAQIIAAKVYPEEARQKRQECFVSYTVTVDRTGALIEQRIDPCGHPLLDAAVRDALQRAAPFPAPPDTGAERYDIHGSLVFRLN